MICAYDELYLDKARTALARMFDFAVYDLKYKLSDFFRIFAHSYTARQFERGEASVVVGRSGVELTYIVTEGERSYEIEVKPRFTANRSREYWHGWALAYYQWRMNLSFLEIEKYLEIEDLLELYSPYHEMDVHHFVERVNEMYVTAKKDTNLKLQRMKAGFTQKELADQTGIPIRTIQQYEQKQKNINKASAEYLLILSRALVCEPERLLEPEIDFK